MSLWHFLFVICVAEAVGEILWILWCYSGSDGVGSTTSRVIQPTSFEGSVPSSKNQPRVTC